jgi:iron complex outermembrane recepter protein
MAETIDFKLEYYTKSNGVASVTVFRRWNKDRITTQSLRGGDTVPNTPDNGFDGLYGGFAILAPRNNGTAVFDGLEFDFRQRLSFLPGLWRGLTARGNVSFLKAEQRIITQFTAAGEVLNTFKAKTDRIPFVVPISGNLGLLYTYKKWGGSFDLNFTDEYTTLQSYPINNGLPITNPNGNVYRKALTTMSVGVNYRIRPFATLFMTINNVAAQGPQLYVYEPSRLRLDVRQPLSISMGVNGQF